MLDLPLGFVIVNRLHRRHFAAATLERLRASTTERALLGCVAEHGAEESGWATINAAYLARLREEVGEAPLLELPFLFVEEFDRAEVVRLSSLLEEGMAGLAVPRRKAPTP